MSEWDVHLVYVDDKSKKFWRARKEGNGFVVGWGRIGTEGQSQTKSFGSTTERDAELDKLVESKKKKGYVDEGGGRPAAPAATPLLEAPNELALALDANGRSIEVKLELEGDRLKTVVVERYGSADVARAALLRIQIALEKEGYR